MLLMDNPNDYGVVKIFFKKIVFLYVSISFNYQSLFENIAVSLIMKKGTSSPMPSLLLK